MHVMSSSPMFCRAAGGQRTPCLLHEHQSVLWPSRRDLCLMARCQSRLTTARQLACVSAIHTFLATSAPSSLLHSHAPRQQDHYPAAAARSHPSRRCNTRLGRPVPAFGSRSGSTKKQSFVYVCPVCDHRSNKKLIACPDCKTIGTMVEEVVLPKAAAAIPSPAVGLINQTRSTMKQPKPAAAPTLSTGSSSAGRVLERSVATDLDDEDEDEEQGGMEHHSGRGSWLGGDSQSRGHPRSLSDLQHASHGDDAVQHIQLAGRTGVEIGRALAGSSNPGVVPGSFVLVGGDPGIGKSTLMLQLAAMVSDPTLDFDVVAEAAAGGAGDEGAAPARGGRQEGAELRRVLYVTGEEKELNVYDRAARMGLDSCSSLYILSMDVMEDILSCVVTMQPMVMVVDSIQTMHMRGVAGSPGSPSQVKECGQVLRYICNSIGTTVILIGHVTKTGEVAGPKMLEHMVDTVLFLEGEASEGRRLLRVHKNRNGPTDEVGVFKMDMQGMHAVESASSLFLDMDRGEAGQRAAVLGVSMMGNRAVMLEVQALCSRAYNLQAPLVRQSTGASKDRFMQLVHVMSKVLPSCKGLNTQHIYCTVVGGAQFKEPAADLAMALAIASSFFDAPLRPRLAVFGEVDLAGQLRSVGQLEQRLGEVAQLGHCDVCIVPKGQSLVKLGSRFPGLTLIPCGSLYDALREALGPAVDRAPASARAPRRSAAADEEEGGDADFDA